MESIITIFGEGEYLTPWQMSARALVVFFIALLLIRISGRRTFGRKSAFDICIVIILGAVLSRAVVGVSPFLATVAASLMLVLLHRVLGLLILYSKTAGKILKGNKRLLYANGQINEQNLRKCLMTHNDLSDVRLKANTENLDHIAEIYMENTGDISVVFKK